MRIFQLDQCFNDRRFADQCNFESEEQAQTFRFPRRLFGAPDPAVLADLLPRGNPLVTVDHAMPEEHAAQIGEPHPGVIVVCYTPNVRRTMTTSAAAGILAGFKKVIPGWHQLSVANSVLFITEAHVEVCRVEARTLLRGKPLSYADSAWTAQMMVLLEANAARPSLP